MPQTDKEEKCKNVMEIQTKYGVLYNFRSPKTRLR